MGTLCKNCPYKGVKNEGNTCTQMFARKYHTSCVNYDIAEETINKSLLQVDKTTMEGEDVKESQIKPSEPSIDTVTITDQPTTKKTARKPNNGRKRPSKKTLVKKEEES